MQLLVRGAAMQRDVRQRLRVRLQSLHVLLIRVAAADHVELPIGSGGREIEQDLEPFHRRESPDPENARPRFACARLNDCGIERHIGGATPDHGRLRAECREQLLPLALRLCDGGVGVPQSEPIEKSLSRRRQKGECRIAIAV